MKNEKKNMVFFIIKVWQRGWGLSTGVSIHYAAELFFGMFMKAKVFMKA